MSGGGCDWPKRATFVLLAIGVFVGALSLFQGCANNACREPLATLRENQRIYYADTAASWVAPAKTIKELVDEADVIVVGIVDCVVGVANQTPYEAAETCKGEFDYPPRHLAHPQVDYFISVERVILDDGTIGDGKPMLFRGWGRWQAGNSHPAFDRMPAPGDRRLFALAKESDGEIHGMRTWWEQFLIDGERVTYSDELRSPVCLDGKTRPEDFIQALEDAADGKNET